MIKLVSQPEQVDNEAEVSSTQWREEVIRVGVLKALGRPNELLRVSVQPLWGNKFRVNVWTGGSSGNGIPNSYFVTADEGGTILRSEPPIQKQY